MFLTLFSVQVTGKGEGHATTHAVLLIKQCLPQIQISASLQLKGDVDDQESIFQYQKHQGIYCFKLFLT